MLRGTSGGALGAARLAWSSSGTGIAPWHGGTSRTVLVVDNEADLLGSCERLLGPIGHRYLGAGGGLQAIELIDRMEPDLLVTDLRLPGVDGLAVARHARARVPPIPVILMSAYDSPWARRSASETEITAYLPKPFTNAAFLDAVRCALAGGASGPAAAAPG